MKKLLIGICILCCVLLITGLGTTGLISWQTEKQVRNYLSHDQQAGKGALEHTLVDYQRSFFRSQATTRLDVRNTPLNAWVDELQFTHQITHGPLWFEDNHSRLNYGLSLWQTELDLSALDTDIQRLVKTAFAGAPPLMVKTRLDFRQQASLQAQLAALKTVNEHEESLELEPAQLNTQFSLTTAADIPLQLSTDKLAFRNDGLQMVLPNLKLDSHLSADNQQDTEFSFRSTATELLLAGEITPLRFDLEGQSSYHTQGDDLSGKLKLKLDQFQALPYPLQALAIDLDYTGLDLQGLQQLNKLQNRLQDLQAQLDWERESLETPEARRRLFQLETASQTVADQILNTLFNQTLQADKSRLNYRMTAHGAEGDILSHAELQYAGTAGQLSLNDVMFFGLPEWGRLWRGELVVDAEQAALPETLSLLLDYPIREQGILENNGHYRINLKLLGNAAELNGRVLAFNELAGKFYPQPERLEQAMGLTIPADLLAMIEHQGLTAEVMQHLEESDDVSDHTLTMLRQLQEMSQQLQ